MNIPINKMPKNFTGQNCAKCGCCFESEKYESRNRKRRVDTPTFWPKYVDYYKNVSTIIVVKPTDVLCTSCHHHINRCKVPPDANSINDVRLQPLCIERAHLETSETSKVEAHEDSTMSSRLYKNKLARVIQSQELDVSQDRSLIPNKQFVSPSMMEERDPEEVQNFKNNEALMEKDVIEPTDSDMGDDCVNKSIQDDMDISNHGADNLTIKSRENSSMTVSTTVMYSQSVCEDGLIDIIKRMVEDGRFYDDKLKFYNNNGGKLNIKINSQMLQLWHVRKCSAVVCKNTFQLDLCSISLLENILKFIHTAATPSFREFCQLFSSKTLGVVNSFLLGLFLNESLGKFTNTELKELISRIDSNEIIGPASKMIMFFINNDTQLKSGFSNAFKFIEESFDIWNDFNILDGNEVKNFSRFQKYYFYFWLYHRKTSEPDANIISHVLSGLKPSSSMEADEYFEFVATETGAVINIRMHSIILHLRQEVNYEEYLINVCNIRSNMRKKQFSQDSMLMFMKVLYFGKEFFRQIIKPSLSSSFIELAQLFMIKRPRNLFGCDVCPTSALDVRMLVDLFLNTGSEEHLDCLLREPKQYLDSKFTTCLRTHQLYSILIQDDLQMKELDVYDLVIRFADDNYCEDEEEQFKTMKGRLDKLLLAVRFGVMSDAEFKIVERQAYLPSNYKYSFFYLIHHPDEPIMSSLDQFHAPTTKRKLMRENPN